MFILCLSECVSVGVGAGLGAGLGVGVRAGEFSWFFFLCLLLQCLFAFSECVSVGVGVELGVGVAIFLGFCSTFAEFLCCVSDCNLNCAQGSTTI